jgi:hypothetical protein
MKILALLLLLVSTAAFAKDHVYQEGKLLSVSKQNDSSIGTGLGNMALAVPMGHAIFTVQISDIVYIVRGEKVNRRTKDYSKGLIIGDPVKVAVEGNNLILLLPTGKDFSTAILTRERSKQ